MAKNHKIFRALDSLNENVSQSNKAKAEKTNRGESKEANTQGIRKTANEEQIQARPRGRCELRYPRTSYSDTRKRTGAEKAQGNTGTQGIDKSARTRLKMRNRQQTA